MKCGLCKARHLYCTTYNKETKKKKKNRIKTIKKHFLERCLSNTSNSVSALSLTTLPQPFCALLKLSHIVRFHSKVVAHEGEVRGLRGDESTRSQ